jgi:hypothetical protein
MDAGADGLAPSRIRDGPFDVVYSDGVTTTNFDGNWKGQKLAEREYQARFDQFDDRYAAMLAALIDTTRTATVSTTQR